MAQAVDITQILQHAQSPDANLRNQAEQQLNQFNAQNPAGYLLSLASELANGDKPHESRQIAGLLLKNSLDAPSEAKKAELAASWQAMDGGVKQQIKQALLATLASEVQVARHTTALVIAKVAAIELPGKQWPEMVPSLLGNMSVQPPNSGLKQATLETFGYICEEISKIETVVLEQEEINHILTAVVQGMRKEEADNSVRLAATTALFNALEFAQTNFENPDERNYLMQVICEGTISEAAKVREAAFECLVKIASLYYEKLPAYMQDIFNLTHKAAREDEEEVAKQAIEFWCTVSEEEIDLQSEIDDGDSTVVHHHFVKQALQPLVELLLQQVTKQEEDQDKDEGVWNISMAAGTCLGLVANVVGDEIVPLVMPYVQEYIHKSTSPEDWRWREAATFVFGSILEGPTEVQLASLVNMGLGFLLNAMKDTNSQVRHTTAWTIGRIFENLHGTEVTPPIINTQNLPQIVSVLLTSIRDEPHIAEKVCYALSQLAAGFKDAESTSLLSPYFKDIVAALLETAQRTCDVQEQSRLQLQAFEGINEVVRSASADTLPLVGQLIPLMLGKLGATFQQAADPNLKERNSELQGLLCGVLQVIVQKLSETDTTKAAVLQYADAIMEALLSVLASRGASIHEEAMLAVGALTYACGTQFIKYMDKFFPFLELGLINHQEWQVCQVTVGVLGDVCRAVEEQIFPYGDKIMQILLSNLQSNDVQRMVKPQILSCFGDVALAIGDRFDKYLPHVLQMLQSAQQLSVLQQQTGDEESFEYNNLLRHGIFEAYSGVFNGLSKEKVDAFLKPYAQSILDFEEYVFSDRENQDESVQRTAIALLGDIANQLSGVGALFAQKAFVQHFLQQGRQSGDPGLVEAANWANAAINKAIVSSSTTATSK
ncbi:hypothetical protein WJX72_008531 [[Myrmecia] bisecta]|uniref:Importin N-terminal domain-containing protein n=1 Tax=[Myrmecia] bisecta TaxID=41462 RepID=A0AAW1PFP3_9CHLO